MSAGRPLLRCRWALGSACALGWLCAIWRVAAGEGGPVEASVTAGGWGLSILPVHVARGRPARKGEGTRRAAAAGRPGRGNGVSDRL